MTKNRLEAFSDAVIAIVITIMVLEMKVPHGTALEDLRPILPVALSYLLSFVFLGIYWNNHHHMLHTASHVGGGVLWANMHLLFWLSLVPFVTGWMGENGFAAAPEALYGGVLLMAAIAYYVLAHALAHRHGSESAIRRALGTDFKGRVSVLFYVVAIPLAFPAPWAALAIYVLVALMWLVPDKRMERVLGE